MATATPTKAPQLILSALNTAYSGATLRCMLVTGYVFDPDTHPFVDSVTGEITGTGYVAGGMAVPNWAFTYDAATDTVRVTGDPIVWDPSSITADQAVFYINTGTPATSPIITVWDYAQQQSVNGPFTVTPHADGIATVA